MINANKKVTIIVPVYNAECYLKRCLQSLVDQTINAGDTAPYVILLINDGSTDASQTIIQSFVDDHPSLFISVSRENRGAAYTRNEGILLCATPYLMFVDNDDVVDCDYVGRHLAKIEETKADIVISGYRRESDTKILKRVSMTNDAWSKYRCVAPWAKIFNTRFLRDNNIRFFDNNIGEDTVFSLKAYAFAQTIESMEYLGYVWRFNNESVSNSIQRGLKSECKFDALLDEILAQVTSNKERELREYFLYRYVVWYLLFSGKYADRKRFVQAFNHLYSWLENNSIRAQYGIFSKEIASESFIDRLAVACFSFLRRHHLEKLFATVYCHG